MRQAVADGLLPSGLRAFPLPRRLEERALSAIDAMPAIVGEDTPPGFDERAYLDAHDDVRQAVADGLLRPARITSPTAAGGAALSAIDAMPASSVRIRRRASTSEPPGRA